MKKILSIIFCFLFYYSINAQSCLSMYADEITSEYMFANSLVNYTSSPQFVRPTRIKIHVPFSSVKYYNYYYDNYGKLIKKDVVYYGDVNKIREEFIYAGDKLVKKETYQLVDSAYVISSVTNYIEINDTLREIIIETPSDTGFTVSARYVYEYSDGLLKTVILAKKVLNGWESYKKDELFYYPNGLLQSRVFSEYDSLAAGLKKTQKYAYIYNDNGLISKFGIYKWDYGLWSQLYGFNAIYNASSLLSKFHGYNDDWDCYVNFSYNTWNDVVRVNAFGARYVFHTYVYCYIFMMMRASFNNTNHYLDFYTDELEITYETVTKVSKESEIVSEFNLSQNYPNPFNPSTNINFSLPNAEFVTLKIYDILGKEVTTLVNEELNAGNYTKTWDAKNLSSGIYFYKLTAGKFSETKKMILVR